MNGFLKQSTIVNVPVFMRDVIDHVTGKTGLTLTITASKNGASFASIAPTVTELANGWYNIAFSTTHTNTLGFLSIHITGTGADPFDEQFQVIAFDLSDSVRLGLTALPNAAAAATGGLPTVDSSNAIKVQSGTGANQISLSSGLVALQADQAVNTTKWAGTATTTSDIALSAAAVRAAVGLATASLDTQITGILTSLLRYVQVIIRKDAAIATDAAAYLTLINADIGTGVGAYDNTTDSVQALRDQGDAAWITNTAANIRAAIGIASANIDTQLSDVAVIKAKTDNLPADPADASDIAASFASIISTLADIIAYIDTEIAAIKAKTDLMAFNGAGEVSANIKSVNNVAIQGDGTNVNKWRPV